MSYLSIPLYTTPPFIVCVKMVAKMSKNTKRWNIPVTEHLNQELEDYIAKDSFKTKSEFIREAVRTRLEEENKKLEGSEK